MSVQSFIFLRFRPVYPSEENSKSEEERGGGDYFLVVFLYLCILRVSLLCDTVVFFFLWKHISEGLAHLFVFLCVVFS